MTTGAVYVKFIAHTRTTWTTTEGDPIIELNRLVFEDQGAGVFKALLGDGVTAYSGLSYLAASGSVAWGAITGTLSSQSDLNTALSGKQPVDSDLTTIAGLTATTDNIIQSVGSTWASRTPSQVKTALALTSTDVGLGSVTNALQLVAANNLSDVADASTSRFSIRVPINSRVIVASVANQTLSGTVTIDGVSLVANNRVLLTGQTAGAENGVWQVQTGAWSRPNDFPAAASVQAYTVWVAGGTVYTGTYWGMTATGSVIIDTTAQTWVLSNAARFATLYQPLDSDLTTIAGLTATTDNMIQSVGSAWASRTPSQIKTALGLTIGTNVQAWDADLDTWATKTAPSGTVVGTTDTQTLTNKRSTPRIGTTASSATPSINVDDVDQYNITALAAAITSMTSGLSGTPTDGQKLILRIKDNGTARAITWGASFTSSGAATLLATTVISKTHFVGLIWDAAASLWVCLAVDATGY